MKKTHWLLVKFAFILLSLFVIYSNGLNDVFAQKSGCNTSQACTGWI